MKNRHFKSFLLVGVLAAATCTAMAMTSGKAVINGDTGTGTGIVTLNGEISQKKVLHGGSGEVTMSLCMSADDVLDPERGDASPVDLVIVLDRSGSMRGRKLEDAKAAVSTLLSSLSQRDRLALVSYSNAVQRHFDLVETNSSGRAVLESAIRTIGASGGTNLGAGLRQGIDIIMNSARKGRAGKVVLISDGLANHGITDPGKLGNMASMAVSGEFAISTLGVGRDFNETLMTAIADRGAGRYYYLEDPAAFAEVFQKEFQFTRSVAASGIEIRVPLKHGVSLKDASGYPFEVTGNEALFHPGSLLSGQTRSLYLTFSVPTDKEGVFSIGEISAGYRYMGAGHIARLTGQFRIACVKDKRDVYASIDRKAWEEKVVNENFNSLREKVAGFVREGKKQEAIKSIETYSDEQASINSHVRSSRVSENLEKEVGDLRQTVEQAFQGAPAEVSKKQKESAKALQYKGYLGRRMSR